MFKKESFEVFDIEGLEMRMQGVRAEIQPIFMEIGEQLKERIKQSFPEQEFYLHIAQHRRRTSNAPENTWSAIGTQKRGYKMEPHFQLGIWQDYVFIYLSIIDQPKGQADYAQRLSSDLSLPKDFVLSKDHTKSDFYGSSHLEEFVTRLKNLKKSELEMGRVWKAERFDGQQDDMILQEMLETIDDLLPIYQKIMED
ncbi:DUF1054 domain-containing protein [Lactococcus petauri]|uniref:UPF0637 protein VNN45_01345 n=1 Tax=Lactococcus petauri TaxID=1940789 RepID=A0ABZ2SFL0_9LACT|nr:DUF1054 domain-containing protein [Lactococcus petauri]OAL09424.1 hypothetical protein A7X72_00454 [Lactococcus garvieae]MCI3871163.1 DUF1054 domain-containing protein [Lactococcus petauri]MCQ8275339.1 hypothetical protein [Lactococcus petauri]MCR6588872.1 DUF1054 domain-containing protein [Lactococcus petauri]MCU7363461.1 DUF1054 domain-containing protein [Lactococcus petauri]